MSAGSNFFICSCAILVFTIINLSIGPIINKKVGTTWGGLNCLRFEDEYDEYKKTHPKMSEEDKEEYEYTIRMCNNLKAMHNMEYTSFTFNIVIGFICVLLGLYGLQKEVIPKTGIIGMGCGVVGIVLTLVYVIYNGVVYTNYYESSSIYKVDGDGAYAELDGNKYECFYFNKENDTRALIAKYSDYIKSQYNYDMDFENSYSEDIEKKNCRQSTSSLLSCSKNEYIKGKIEYTDDSSRTHVCQKLYYHNTQSNDFRRYDISARFLTVLLLSIIILLLYCGLIFSSFMLNKESS